MLDLTDILNEFFDVLEREAKVLQSHYDQYAVDISRFSLYAHQARPVRQDDPEY